jgi:hypothetical protein
MADSCNGAAFVTAPEAVATSAEHSSRTSALHQIPRAAARTPDDGTRPATPSTTEEPRQVVRGKLFVL